MTSTPDMINSPPHYMGAGGIEAIDVIEDYTLDYHLGNAAKYIIRAGRKGRQRDDIAKALWYCKRWHTAGAISEARDGAIDIPDVLAAFGLAGNRADALAHILDSALLFVEAGSSIDRAIHFLEAELVEIDARTAAGAA